MSDATYRWHLRQLQREREPSRDLWAGISAAIAQPRQPVHAGRAPAWRATGSALAACAVLGAFAIGLAQPRLLEKIGMHRAAPEHQLVLKEAEAIRKQYQAELRKFDGKPVPMSVTPALLELDRSAESIMVALDSRPDAVFLLDQLRRTYARRLQITQRVAML
ncbi:MAG TPA: hypothetical protein VGH80_09130 [Xanthomonadaceae bacterium]|jgi:hypothetical protein